MPTLMPWTTVEIGDVDIFSPALPSLVVYTWYVDDEPESSVVYFWRDENTGIVHHELVFVGPATFETKPTAKTSVGRSKKPTPVKKTIAPTTARRKQSP
jgi:hypothetical protein